MYTHSYTYMIYHKRLCQHPSARETCPIINPTIVAIINPIINPIIIDTCYYSYYY